MDQDKTHLHKQDDAHSVSPMDSQVRPAVRLIRVGLLAALSELVLQKQIAAGRMDQPSVARYIKYQSILGRWPTLPPKSFDQVVNEILDDAAASLQRTGKVTHALVKYNLSAAAWMLLMMKLNQQLPNTTITPYEQKDTKHVLLRFELHQA